MGTERHPALRLDRPLKPRYGRSDSAFCAGGWGVIRTASVGLMAALATGCASTWDAMSSRQFRRDLVDNPVRALVVSDDPMTVLRTNPDGHARAKAMRKLVEPAANGREDEQAEAMQYLTEAATTDPSPVVRAAAIHASTLR